MVIMNDLKWPMLSYYVIYYEKFGNVMQQTEKVALIMVVKAAIVQRKVTSCSLTLSGDNCIC